MDSERSKLRVRLRGGRAQRESQVDPSTEQSQHPRGLEGANQPRLKGQLPSSPPPSPPSLPGPHQAARAAVPVGTLGPDTQRAVMGKAAGVQALLEPERRGGTRSVSSTWELGAGRGRRPALASGSLERGPDLAGAAVALLALFHEAVPAACPRHQEPGVR